MSETRGNAVMCSRCSGKITPGRVVSAVKPAAMRMWMTYPMTVIDTIFKALSPAINDPTTAVIATDQLHRLLRSVGRRNLRTEELMGRPGELRVICRTPNWEDFVHLAFTEIRQCGAHNIQVARRLRAMIENLVETLPEHRHAALLQQLTLLDREVERRFTYPEERALALVADSQGLGGASGLQGSQNRQA